MLTPLLLLASPVLSLGAHPDIVKLLKGDKVLEGRVVFEGKDEIVLRNGSRDQRIDRKDIAEIVSLERSLALILDLDSKKADAAGLAEIATACEGVRLEAEARNFWLRVLLADPQDEAAAKALGAQVVQGEAEVPFGKEKRSLASLSKRQASWKDSFEVPSTHFVLKTDLDLPLALEVSLALERTHRRFYETLGEPLEMYVLDEVPEVYIYGRAADFPASPVKGETSWFAPGINRLNVQAETDPRVRDVVHDFIRMLLFNALRRSAGATTQVPQWTSTGIAELFAVSAPAERFGKWSEIGWPDTAAFALAKSAGFGLDRVFIAGLNDFNVDAKGPEMSAAAYTLVHYLFFAKGGSLRPGYGRFLREGAKGKISMEAFTAALGLLRSEIEAGWRAHIDQHAK